jgi:hypothetical protein
VASGAPLAAAVCRISSMTCSLPQVYYPFYAAEFWFLSLAKFMVSAVAAFLPLCYLTKSSVACAGSIHRHDNAQHDISLSQVRPSQCNHLQSHNETRLFPQIPHPHPRRINALQTSVLAFAAVCNTVAFAGVSPLCFTDLAAPSYSYLPRLLFLLFLNPLCS